MTSRQWLDSARICMRQSHTTPGRIVGSAEEDSVLGGPALQGVEVSGDVDVFYEVS